MANCKKITDIWPTQQNPQTFQDRLSTAYISSYMNSWILQIVRAHELFHRLPKVVLQQPTYQFILIQIQGAMDWRQTAVYRDVCNCMT